MLVNFTVPPPVGHVLELTYKRHRHVARFTLIGTSPYTRKDGLPSVVLIWRAQGSGAVVTTGLQSKGFSRSIPHGWQWAEGLTDDEFDLIGAPT